MPFPDRSLRRWLALPVIVSCMLVPSRSLAHPLGNFSVSQYAGIRVHQDAVEVRYLIDMAEIPTFQEIQDTGFVPEAGHEGLRTYTARKVEALKEGLLLEVDGRKLHLRAQSSEVIFPSGAGGLPTMKLGVVYRAKLAPPTGAPSSLHYRDGNFPDRAGWKEIIAVAGSGVRLAQSTAPTKDQSRELSDYPTDLLNSPPQDLEARVVFTRDALPLPTATIQPQRPKAEPARPPEPRPPQAFAETPTDGPALNLRANKQPTPRSALTDLVKTKELSLGIVMIALAIAAGLGAFHALEPGHGKTVVAAYLVGSRGTAWHAVLLGLVVTASHTAGVYVLGAVTLYASRYVVPERLYPWLAVGSGVAIAVVGFSLFLRKFSGPAHVPAHTHGNGEEDHHHHGPDGYRHDHGHDHHHHHLEPGSAVTLPALVALGVTGGIVPCPAALVVLLSSLALNRVSFGLVLIVAFSVGLAVVLITIGMLMVYARRFMARFQADGPLIQRWLPLTSSAVITLLGVAIAVQGVLGVGILPVRF